MDVYVLQNGAVRNDHLLWYVLSYEQYENIQRIASQLSFAHFLLFKKFGCFLTAMVL